MDEENTKTEIEENILEAIPDDIENKPSFPLWVLISGFVTAAVSLFIFGDLAEDLLENPTFAFDHIFIDYIHTFQAEWFRKLMLYMTYTGSLAWIGISSVLVIIWLFAHKKDKLSVLFFLVNVAGGGLLNYILKLAFHRDRPSVDPSIGAIGFSFPSGHAMGSMIFYGFIGYLIINSQRSRRVKAFTLSILITFIVLIGLSRIYLNAHYPSDVIAGYSAGLFWLLLCIFSLRIIKFRNKRKKRLSASV